MNPILSLANGNNWFSVNRDIARAVGLNAAIMLSEVINKYEFFKEKGSLENGWFYLTIEDAEERTTLARDAQAGAIKILKDLKIIETKQMGMPSKRYFRFDEDAFSQWIKEMFAECGNSENKKAESRKQDVGIPVNKMSEFPTPVKRKNPPMRSKGKSTHIVSKEKQLREILSSSSSPPQKSVPLDTPTKEEEEELCKRMKERPKNAPKIKCPQKWKAALLPQIREEMREEQEKNRLQQEAIERIERAMKLKEAERQSKDKLYQLQKEYEQFPEKFKYKLTFFPFEWQRDGYVPARVRAVSPKGKEGFIFEDDEKFDEYAKMLLK